MPQQKIRKDFIEAIRLYSNAPEKLFDLAKTDFEKMVAVEFFQNDKEHSLMAQKFEHQNKLLWGIFGVTIATAVGFLIRLAISSILGVPF